MIFAILFGCDTTPQGWVKTNETNGPKVIYDLQSLSPYQKFLFPMTKQLAWIHLHRQVEE